MPITLTTPPPALSFSADLISAKFQCTGYLQQVGVKSVNKFTLDSFSTGDIFTFKYGSKTVVMTVSLTPDDSGNQLPANNGPYGITNEIYLSYFRANYQFANDFEMTLVGSDIIFTAKEVGLGYDFIASPIIAAVNVTPGVAEIARPNYTVLFRLWLENEANNNFDLIYSTNLSLLPGTNGTAEAMIGDKLHVAMSSAIRANYPEQPTTAVIQCKLSCRRYYFEFAESYGEPIIVRRLHRSELYTAMHGGLSTIGQYNTNALALLAPSTADNDKFLKQGSTTVLTRTNQPQYLYFVNTRPAKTVSIKTKIVFTDDSISMATISGVQMQQYRKYAFNASLLALYTNPIPGKIVKEYTVYLLEGANRVSEERKYIIDYSTRKYIRYFLNWSSWGALDSRVTYGQGESEYELTNKTAERVLRKGDDIRAGASIVFDSEIYRSFKVASGWLDKRELDLYADFYLSNLKYRYSRDMMLPIAVNTGKITEFVDGENLLAQSFEYKYLIKDHAYTEGDAEDTGMSIAGYNVSFYPSATAGSGGIGVELDPTVPAWVKNITESDIAKWNANIATAPTSYGNWLAVNALHADIVGEMALQYKTDYANDADKVITYLAGQFTLNPTFVGTSVVIGSLPSGHRPPVKLVEYYIVDNIELFLTIDTNGEISVVSKDGFDLPTGVANEKRYFVNLNFKPAVALSAVAGKWVIDPAGTTCETGNTGYQINTLLKRVSDNVNEYPLDTNDNYTSASGLPQATAVNPTTAANYKVYNAFACPIPAGKWIVNTANYYCEAGGTGYKIYPQLVRVSDDAAQAPYDVNDNYCSASGLPQATAVNPSSSPTYKEYNTAACPLATGPVVTGDIDFTLQQYGRKLGLSGSVAMLCQLSVTVMYRIHTYGTNGDLINISNNITDVLTLQPYNTQVLSANSITQKPTDYIEIMNFSFTPKYCGNLQVFVNGQEGEEGGSIV